MLCLSTRSSTSASYACGASLVQLPICYHTFDPTLAMKPSSASFDGSQGCGMDTDPAAVLTTRDESQDDCMKPSSESWQPMDDAADDFAEDTEEVDCEESVAVSSTAPVTGVFFTLATAAAQRVRFSAAALAAGTAGEPSVLPRAPPRRPRRASGELRTNPATDGTEGRYQLPGDFGHGRRRASCSWARSCRGDRCRTC